MLRALRGKLDADLHLRGNVLTLEGEPDDVEQAAHVVDEMVELIEQGHEVAPGTIEAVTGALEARRGPGRDPRGRRLAPPQHQGRAEDAQPEALRRLDPPQHDHLRDRPGRHRQDLPRGGDGGRGADRTRGAADHPHPARGRGGRAARLPARRHPGQGRPLPAAALRRPLRHDRPRPRQRLLRARRDRGRAAGLHAGPGAAGRQPVLTPSGFRPIGSLEVGDLVVGSDGLPTPVLGVYPQGRKEVFR